MISGKPVRMLRTGFPGSAQEGNSCQIFLFHSKNVFRIFEDFICLIDIILTSLCFAL